MKSIALIVFSLLLGLNALTAQFNTSVDPFANKISLQDQSLSHFYNYVFGNKYIDSIKFFADPELKIQFMRSEVVQMVDSYKKSFKNKDQANIWFKLYPSNFDIYMMGLQLPIDGANGINFFYQDLNGINAKTTSFVTNQFCKILAEKTGIYPTTIVPVLRVANMSQYETKILNLPDFVFRLLHSNNFSISYNLYSDPNCLIEFSQKELEDLGIIGFNKEDGIKQLSWYGFYEKLDVRPKYYLPAIHPQIRIGITLNNNSTFWMKMYTGEMNNFRMEHEYWEWLRLSLENEFLKSLE